MRASQVAKIQWNRWRTFSLHSDRMWIVLCFPGPVQKLQCTVTPWRNQVIWQGMYNWFHRKTGSHIWEVHLYIQMKSVFFHLYIQRSFYRMNNPPIRQKQKKLSVWPEFVSSSSALHQPIHFHQHEIRKGQDPGGNQWRIGGQRDYHHLDKREA